jgi:formylglycine-generating enzyme required for sulfatase activity
MATSPIAMTRRPADSRSRRYLTLVSAVLAGGVLMPGTAAAQAPVCTADDARPSFVRIERQAGRAPGTGVVIVRRDTYAVVLTARHVLEGPGDFGVYFQVDPQRRIAVKWNEAVYSFAADADLAVFRVDARIPPEVVPEDPFADGVSDGQTLVPWGYPAARGGALCSYEGKLQTTAGGLLIIDRSVDEGVSGGPVFFRDRENGTWKLAGIVKGGDSTTTNAIDIRQAVTVVATSRDPRNGGKAHVWPNIPLRGEIVVDALSRSFLKVDTGPFLMGSNNVDDEKWPDAAGGKGGQKTLTLGVFYMGKYEVTVAQYAECVSAGRCTHGGRNLSSSEANHPVVGVTWQEARQYAEWLQTRLLGNPGTPIVLRRLLDAGWQIDLPSEEEWEKAARGARGNIYPWGNDPNPRYANYNTGELRVVGSKACQKNCAYGLEDMAGNAREWTRSLKLPYPYVAATAENSTAAGNRAIRGGSYNREQRNPLFAAQVIRATNRQEAVPTTADQYTGFRLALICRKDRGCSWQEPD